MSFSTKRDPFAVHGTITVRDSATVMLVRRHPNRTPVSLSPEDCGGDKSPFLQSQSSGVFGSSGKIQFDGSWEVLLGQAEVINWLKTTPEKIQTMRYAGEWKLAGGNVDEGESIAAAAVRELQEEFLDPLDLLLPSNAVLRPFITKQTRPIRSRSNLMHCFICLESENPWLRTLDVDDINRGLGARRQQFQELSLNSDGTPTQNFYHLSMAEREAVTPEVREVKWVPLHDAVQHTLSSMTPGTSVNDFQRASFQKYGIRRRDPMFITGAILMELEGFSDELSVIEHCESVDLEALTREEQWLFEGMDGKQVKEAFKQRVSAGAGTNPSFKNPDFIKKLRKQRSARSSKL
jgi:8-oxo-dGTP pyrophosphatase MutT (NUDIX family)